MYILLSPAQIADNISMCCKAQGISVKALCQTQKLGVNTVQQMRKDGHYPRIDTLFKIASGLHCTIEELCTREVEEEKIEGVEE